MKLNPASMLHFAQISVAPQKGKKIRNMGSMAKKPPFIRRLKHSENHVIVSNSP